MNGRHLIPGQGVQEQVLYSEELHFQEVAIKHLRGSDIEMPSN
jgi:hypothetical protein